MKLHYNFIKNPIDEFFTEIIPKEDENNNPIIEIYEEQENRHYSVKAIDTKDEKKLAEFADRKLKEYLNKLPIYNEGEKVTTTCQKFQKIMLQIRTCEQMKCLLKFKLIKQRNIKRILMNID